MERFLKIQKFRNIGLKTEEKLILNSSMKKGELGNLIIVVGANNSGKSNVLDALMCFGNKKIEQRDVTTLSYEEKDRKPSLALVTKDGTAEYSYTMTYGQQKAEIVHSKSGNKAPMETAENNKAVCEKVVAIARQYGGNASEWEALIKTFSKKSLTKTEHMEAEKTIKQKLTDYKAQNGYYDNFPRAVVERLKQYFPTNTLCQAVFATTNEAQILYDEYQKKYGVRFMPTITRYTERRITNEDLRVDYQDVSSNAFMKALFQAIKVDQKEIQAVYDDYRRLKNKGLLASFAKKINKKLKEVAKKFNALYFFEDDTYKFEIDLESSQIFFMMFRGAESISLDYQSTGFRWFFNLYFNLLVSNGLAAGDILIMDEPATSLHPYGQAELRKFLKEFAIKNDLTIILATHSPFLVDIDYLDELRVVTMDENISRIENDFSTIDRKDPDSLKPIKEALTVNNHMLYDPDKTVVFVEGITDYNYMVAFRKILKQDDVIFLPVNGVGDMSSNECKSKQVELSKALMRIKKHNPILLVDGDPAGKSIQKLNDKDSGLEVVTLSDVDEKFKDIEDLFDEADLEKFNLKIKRSHLSALFKTHHAKEKEVSAKTKNNFKKVFERLLD